MRGHIHKRVRKNKRGKETTSWYVIIDVGVNADGAGSRNGTAHSGPAGRLRSRARRSSPTSTGARTSRPIGSPWTNGCGRAGCR